MVVATLANKTSTGGSVTTLQSAAYNQAAGRCIVVVCAGFNAGGVATSVTDTAGNDANYVAVYSGTGYSGGGSSTLQIFYVKNCLGNAANQITVHYSSSASFAGFFYYDVSGADLTAPLDAVMAGAISTLVNPTSSEFTTTNPNEAVIFFGGQTNNSSPTSPAVTIGVNALASSLFTSGIPANFSHLASQTWASDATEGAYATALDGNGIAVLYENGQSYPNDQFSEATLEASVAPGNSIGPAVRISASADTFYCMVSNGTNAFLLKYINGSQTILAVSARTYVQGDIYRVVAQGTNIYGYVGDRLFLAAIDSDIASGAAGIIAKSTGSSTTCTMSGWSGGSITALTMTQDGSIGQGRNQYLSQNGSTSSLLTNARSSFVDATTGWVSAGVTIKAPSTPPSSVYSVPDCRVAPFGPNASRTVQGTKIYDVQVSDNSAIPPTDSRASKPVDSRTTTSIPQNSRAPGTFGPGQN